MEPSGLRRLLGWREAALTSPLTPGECQRRLREVIDGRGTLFGNRPVIGSVGDGRASLRRRTWYRNSFQTVLAVNLEADGSHTLLKCRSGMSPYVVGFMGVWFAIVVLIGAVAGTAGVAVQGTPWIMAAAPLFMFAFGAAMVVFGRYLARGEHDFLMDFLLKTTDARPAS